MGHYAIICHHSGTHRWWCSAACPSSCCNEWYLKHVTCSVKGRHLNFDMPQIALEPIAGISRKHLTITFEYDKGGCCFAAMMRIYCQRRFGEWSNLALFTIQFAVSSAASNAGNLETARHLYCLTKDDQTIRKSSELKECESSAHPQERNQSWESMNSTVYTAWRYPNELCKLDLQIFLGIPTNQTGLRLNPSGHGLLWWQKSTEETTTAAARWSAGTGSWPRQQGAAIWFWWSHQVGVSINGGTPKWMVYKGKSN